MRDKLGLAVKYAIFAVIATIVNIASQEFIFQICKLNFMVKLIDFVCFYVPKEIFIFIGAIGFGTLTGLIVKYVLDKKYIFYFVTKSKKEDAKKFAIYTVMGIITTIIFWGSETIFYLLWDEKYIGAVVGLMIGYVSKYFLDKKFVFK